MNQEGTLRSIEGVDGDPNALVGRHGGKGGTEGVGREGLIDREKWRKKIGGGNDGRTRGGLRILWVCVSCLP